MKFLKIFVVFVILLYISGCEPVRVTTKVNPIEIEPPEESVTVKKIPYDAVVIVDEDKTYTATQYTSDTIHDVVFPSGNLLKQALPIYFDRMFNKVKYEKSISTLPQSNTLIIVASMWNMNFKEDCCQPLTLDVGVTAGFDIWDSDLIPISMPLHSSGSGKISKSGLFSSLDNKEYAQTAYQAILNAVKNGSALIYDSVQNPQKVLLNAKDEINKEPSNISAYKVVANLSLKTGDIAQALAASQMVVQLNPKDIDGYMLLYKCYMAQRKYKDAIAQLEQAFSLNPKNALVMMKQSDFYIERKKYDRVIQIIKKYISERPDDKNAFSKLAFLYFRFGNYKDAISTSEGLLNSLSFSGIGISIKKDNETLPKVMSIQSNSPASESGIRVNDEIVEIDGISTKNLTINDIVNKLRGQDRTPVTLKIKREEELINKTLIRDTFYTDPYQAATAMSLMALCYLELGDNINAQKFIDSAVKTYPKAVLTQIAIASLMIKDGRYDEAIKTLSDVKQNDYAVFLLAVATAKKGNYEDSIKIYRNVSDSDNIFIGERAKNSYFETLTPYMKVLEEKAIEYERKGQLSSALKEYKKMLEFANQQKAQWIRSRVARIITNNPSVVDMTGAARQYYLNAEVLFTNNKFEEAITELDRAKEIIPFNPQIYFNKALIYGKLADYAQAIENMEIFLQLNPTAPNTQTIRDQIYKWRFLLEKEL